MHTSHTAPHIHYIHTKYTQYLYIQFKLHNIPAVIHTYLISEFKKMNKKSHIKKKYKRQNMMTSVMAKS